MGNDPGPMCKLLQCDPTDPIQDYARAMRQLGLRDGRTHLRSHSHLEGLLSVDVQLKRPGVSPRYGQTAPAEDPSQAPIHGQESWGSDPGANKPRV